MKKRETMSLVAVLVIGVLLWGFYLIQEEFAKYGMYRLISYRVHELSSLIVLLCPLVSLGCTVYLLVRLLKRTSDTTGKILLIVFLLCLLGQFLYFQDNSEKVRTVAVCTVEEVNEQNGSIVISLTNGRDGTVTLECPAFFRGLLIERTQLYLVTFESRKNNRNEGELTMIKLAD